MTLTPWQRSNILTALNYLKDLGRLGQNTQASALAQGLIEVLEPSRRTIRLQREAAQSATASAQAGNGVPAIAAAHREPIEQEIRRSGEFFSENKNS